MKYLAIALTLFGLATASFAASADVFYTGYGCCYNVCNTCCDYGYYGYYDYDCCW